MEKSVCEILNEAKKRHGYTNDNLAAMSGIPDGTLGKIMAGQTACTAENYIKLMTAMGEFPITPSDEPKREITVQAVPTLCKTCEARAAILESYRNSLENERHSFETTLAKYESHIKSKNNWLMLCVAFIALQFIALFYIAMKL